MKLGKFNLSEWRQLAITKPYTSLHPNYYRSSLPIKEYNIISIGLIINPFYSLGCWYPDITSKDFSSEQNYANLAKVLRRSDLFKQLKQAYHINELEIAKSDIDIFIARINKLLPFI